MNGINQPYYKNSKTPAGYNDAPNPYKCYSGRTVDLARLSKYVESSGKLPTEFSKEEMDKFLV